MHAVAELPFDHLVGGHGPVQNGKTHSPREMAAYIEEITTVVEREKSKPLPQLQSSIVPSSLKTLSGDYGQFLLQNFRAGGSATDPAAALAGGVRNNVAQVYERLRVA